jgi:hypothetical protein
MRKFVLTERKGGSIRVPAVLAKTRKRPGYQNKMVSIPGINNSQLEFTPHNASLTKRRKNWHTVQLGNTEE